MPSPWKIAGALLASAVALLSAYTLSGGRYQLTTGQAGAPMRLDRWTGEMMVCTTRLCVIYPTRRPEHFTPPPTSPSSVPEM